MSVLEMWVVQFLCLKDSLHFFQFVLTLQKKWVCLMTHIYMTQFCPEAIVKSSPLRDNIALLLPSALLNTVFLVIIARARFVLLEVLLFDHINGQVTE